MGSDGGVVQSTDGTIVQVAPGSLPEGTTVSLQTLPTGLLEPGFDPNYAVDFWDLTNRQDWRACESVQRGVSSRGYRPGPLAPSEIAVHHFIRMVAGGYLAGRPVGPTGPPISGPTGGAP